MVQSIIVVISLFLGFAVYIVQDKKKWIHSNEDYKYLEKRHKQLLEENQNAISKRRTLEEENRNLQEELAKVNVELILKKQGVEEQSKQEAQVYNRISERQLELSKIIEEGTAIAKENVDKFTAEYKENEMSRIRSEHEAVLSQYRLEEQQTLEQIAPIKQELENYEAKRRAIIEAQKREQELRDQMEYHRIKLTADAIEDIGYIRSILDKVRKKEIVAKVVWESYISGPTKEMLNRVVGKEKKCGIYRITNIRTQECYVGQGVDVAKRLTEHVKGTLGIQTIADQRIHHAMADEGLENWTFELLEECDKEQLNEREKYYISYYKSNEFGFNRTVGG